MPMQNLASKWLLGAAVLGVSLAALAGAPPAKTLNARIKDVDAKVAAARSHHAALQAQVASMERQNAAQQQQLQQRDAEIASLRQKLASAGVPAASASAGH